MVFLSSIESILSIIIMITVGYVLTHIGWLTDESSKTFSKIILNVSLPCYMIYNLTSSFDRKKLELLSSGLLIPIITIAASYIISIAVSNVLKIKAGRKGVFRSIFFVSNTIFIGLPVNIALFGESSVPYVLLYYIANTTFFWTVGVYEISKDSGGGDKRNFFSRKTLKRILSPTLMGFSLGILFVLFDIPLPEFATESFKYIGELTTPLAMFFIGIVMHSVKPKELILDKDMTALVAARFLICPFLVLAALRFIPVPSLMGKVFVIQSSMPAMTSTGVVAKGYGSDYQFAAVATVITTVLSMIVIPLYMCFI